MRQVPQPSAHHRERHGAAIADGEHAGRGAMHVVRRAEHRRQRQRQDQRHRAGEAEYGDPEHDPSGRAIVIMPRRKETTASRSPHRPKAASPAVRPRRTSATRRQLSEIDRGERAADQVGTPAGDDVVGQKRVGDKVGRIDAAQDETELPDERTSPVRPPPFQW